MSKLTNLTIKNKYNVILIIVNKFIVKQLKYIILNQTKLYNIIIYLKN